MRWPFFVHAAGAPSDGARRASFSREELHGFGDTFPRSGVLLRSRRQRVRLRHGPVDAPSSDSGDVIDVGGDTAQDPRVDDAGTTEDATDAAVDTHPERRGRRGRGHAPRGRSRRGSAARRDRDPAARRARRSRARHRREGDVLGRDEVVLRDRAGRVGRVQRLVAAPRGAGVHELHRWVGRQHRRAHVHLHARGRARRRAPLQGARRVARSSARSSESLDGRMRDEAAATSAPGEHRPGACRRAATRRTSPRP